MKYPKHDHRSVGQITPNIPTDIFRVLAQLCVPGFDPHSETVGSLASMSSGSDRWPSFLSSAALSRAL